MRMPHRWPKSVVVGNTEYEVRIVKRIPGHKKLEGLIISDPSEELAVIYIKRQRRKLMLDTLIHEIHHAFEFEYGIKIRHKLIYQLAELWTEFLRQN